MQRPFRRVGKYRKTKRRRWRVAGSGGGRVQRECSLELEQSKPPRLSFSAMLSLSLSPPLHQLPLRLFSSLLLCSMNPRGVSSRNITHGAPRLPVSLHPLTPVIPLHRSVRPHARPPKPSRSLRRQPLHPGHATLSPLLRIFPRILWSLSGAAAFYFSNVANVTDILNSQRDRVVLDTRLRMDPVPDSENEYRPRDVVSDVRFLSRKYVSNVQTSLTFKLKD